MKKVYYKLEDDYITLYNRNGRVIDSIEYDARFTLNEQLNFWAENQDVEDTILFDKVGNSSY